MTQGGEKHHANNIKAFAILLIIVEMVIIVLYGVFVRIDKL